MKIGDDYLQKPNKAHAEVLLWQTEVAAFLKIQRSGPRLNGRVGQFHVPATPEQTRQTKWSYIGTLKQECTHTFGSSYQTHQCTGPQKLQHLKPSTAKSMTVVSCRHLVGW